MNCDHCGRRIGAKRTHYLLDTSMVVCGRCVDRTELHHQVAPGCGIDWHTPLDHPGAVRSCTRAAVKILMAEAATE